MSTSKRGYSKIKSLSKAISSWFLARGSDERGIIIVGAYIVTLLFITISVAAAEFGVNHYTNTRRTLVASGALGAAEAGADRFMFEINQASTYVGTNTAPSGTADSCTGYTMAPVTLVNNTTQGKVTYETCAKPGTITGEKLVYATGKVYLPATASLPTLTRKVRLVINQALPTNYTVMTGPGGLTLGSNVSITSGPVYVGGELNLGPNATIGSTGTPVATYVADTNCPIPPDATFPLPCSGGNSITTGPNSHVYGATHPLNNVDVTSKFTNPGVTDHVVPSITLPTADHATLTSGYPNSGGLSSVSCPNNGTVHLSGHYTGSATTTFTSGANCTVILDGDTWLDGNISLGNNTKLTVLNSLATAPNLIIDGSSGLVTGNNDTITANAGNVGINVYTFWSADSTCRPHCTSVTGANLANSQIITTINLSNNVSGTANIKFYARWTKLVLGNNATVGSLIGQTITLNNNGSIIFSDSAGGSPGGGWDVRHYEQIYQ